MTTPVTVVHAHGGGFTSYDPELGAARAQALAAAGLRVVPVAYRLAPEHRCPAQIEDVLDACRGIDGPFVLLGESAGGTIVLSAVARLIDSGRLPLGVAAISPVTDLTLPGASFLTNEGKDIIGRAVLAESVRAYLGGLDPAGPHSPAHLPLENLPPLWLAVGTGEVLLDDVTAFAGRARDAGVRTELRRYPGARHGFQFGESTVDADLAQWLTSLIAAVN
ncbi:alpha/beta hydrolase fold domain-containing protein [Amycolatopsis sp. NPDC059027]|uniref:alpha/beta hydrolase fold domain-containing protein n=1 Tax=Amycolatopsis sp. NPDC059027 TaxID=3346709 RepID=UPI003670F18D